MSRLPRVFRSAGSVTSPRLVGLVSVGHGTNEFASVVLPPIIPLLVGDVGLTYAEAGVLLTIFYAMYSLFQLPVGVLADRVGRKYLFVGGFTAMTAGIALAGLADGFATLAVAQVVAGVGGSTFHPTGLSLLSDIETEATEGRAMGVFGFGGILGTMAAPVLVGGIAVLAGWRPALGVGAVLCGLVTLLFLVRFPAAVGGGSADESSADAGRPRESGSPLRDPVGTLRDLLQIPRSPDVWLLVVLTAVLAVQIRAVQTFTTAYVAEATNGSTSVGNLSFFALLLGGGIASLGAGALADRFDRALLGGATAVVTTVLLGATVFVPDLLGRLAPAGRFLVMAGWFFAVGLSLYAAVPTSNALISQRASASFSGSLFGVIQTVSALGSAAGPAAFGYVASDVGIVATFPLVAVVGVVLAGLFFLAPRTFRAVEADRVGDEDGVSDG